DVHGFNAERPCEWSWPAAIPTPVVGTVTSPCAESERPLFDRLRQLYHAVMAARQSGAPPFRGDELIVLATPYPLPADAWRFAEPSRDHVAGWYREELPTEGWRALHDSQARQVWTRDDHPGGPLLVFDYSQHDFRVNQLSMAGQLPQHPETRFGGGRCGQAD